MQLEQDNVASHTLAYLRKLDRQYSGLLDLVVRQQDLISRLDRNMSEGFDGLRREMTDGFDGVRREMHTLQRDVRELKSDMLLMENRIVSTLSTDLHMGARLTEIEARIAADDPTFKPTP